MKLLDQHGVGDALEGGVDSPPGPQLQLWNEGRQHVADQAFREVLVEDAYRRELLLFVPHIPGVLGRVKKEKRGYRWVGESR